MARGSPAPQSLKVNLALWVAGGGKVSAWCRARGIARPTAYKWYATDEFRGMVEEYRRRAVDRAIGQMARGLGKAVGKIVELIERGQTDGVKLAAAKTLIDKLIEVQDHADLKADLTRLGERLDDAWEGRGAR
jgi:hypothetical protein